MDIEKERAQRAWDRVREVAGGGIDLQRSYRSRVKDGPATIQRNGLTQYLAFLGSKGFRAGRLKEEPKEHAYGLVYIHLGRWLIRALRLQANYPANNDTIRPGQGGNSTNDPLRFLLDNGTTLDDALRATREALAYLQWTRRFADAQLAEPENGDD